MEPALFTRGDTAERIAAFWDRSKVVPVFRKGCILGYAVIVQGKQITEDMVEQVT